ncbi:putative serine protease K12H4.7 [Folsomia candida]|uniref:putative serine protease K12H4.7 n=1 Tax=Folsomia candida TaxID=158441 RepID=UPI001604C298|nr:putative serine protease K12H4.7 [Folsomia candida]
MYFRTISTVLLGIFGLAMAQIPLTFDLSKDQIFVQGNWYNKDGSNGKSVVTPHAFFTQCMHHENASGCDTTWSQRYWVNTNYYQPGRPIFIELAGEWDAAGDVDGGYWHAYARQYNAMLIVLEHRFYGQSFPVQNPAVRDLWLMTSQLALADAAKFITDFTANNNLNGTSWVSFGCSYGANLAAWFKLKYPNHVKAAVSSSGPVEALYDYPGYMKTVSEVVQEIDDVCHDKCTTHSAAWKHWLMGVKILVIFTRRLMTYFHHSSGVTLLTGMASARNKCSSLSE